MTTTELLTLTRVERGDIRLLRDAWHIRAACAYDLLNRFGDGHWARITPLSQLRRTAEQKHLYVVHRDGRSLATFVLSRTGASFLQPKLFRAPEAPAAFLTALAVHPPNQREGVGRWCMAQAEAIARQWDCRSLRFDAYDHPAGAWQFYDRGHYERRAKLDVFGIKLIVYEKTL